MTRARDLANIADGTFTATDLDLSGTLSVSGDATFDTNTLFVDVSANRVGVGTTNPAYLIDAQTAAGNAQLSVTAGGDLAQLILKSTDTTGNSQINFADADSSNVGMLQYFHNDNHMEFTVNGSEAMRITSAGNVGIGTASPAGLLNAHSAAGDANLYVTTGNTAASTNIFFGDSGNSSIGRIVYDHNGDYMKFRTNGQDAMRLDASGNVGIGVVPATDWSTSYHALQIGTTATFMGAASGSGEGNWISNNAIFSTSGSWEYLQTASASSLDMQSSTAPFRFRYAASGTAGTAISWSEAMRIDSSGRLLVGTTSNYGGEALQIDANSVGSTVYTAYISNTNTSTSAYNVMRWAQGAAGSATGMIGTGGSAASNAAFRNSFVVGTQSSSPLVFATADAERARIDSSGNLLVGTTSKFLIGRVCSLAADGIASFETKPSSNISYNAAVFLNSSNTQVGRILCTGSATSYETSSDARLKKNIADAESASELIDAIQVRSFDWKADGSHQRYGMVAQELLEVAPEAVSGDPESDNMMGVDYSKLVPMLVKEIQSLRARVAQLEGV